MIKFCNFHTKVVLNLIIFKKDYDHTSKFRIDITAKKYDDITAVNKINLKIHSGTYCCLLGPSGCGKTSTLRMIAGHEETTDGDILLGNTIINELTPAKRGTSMMFQNYALFPHLNCIDNVAFALKIKNINKKRDIKGKQNSSNGSNAKFC